MLICRRTFIARNREVIRASLDRVDPGHELVHERPDCWEHQADGRIHAARASEARAYAARGQLINEQTPRRETPPARRPAPPSCVRKPRSHSGETDRHP